LPGKSVGRSLDGVGRILDTMWSAAPAPDASNGAGTHGPVHGVR
jgi:hypothetical protein